MKRYLPVYYLGLKNGLIYRANMIMKLVLQLASLLVTVLMWKFILAESGNFQQMARYLLATNLISLIFTTGPVFQFADMVESGNLSLYLTRPLSLYWYLFNYNLGLQTPLLLLYLILLLFLVKSAGPVFLLLIYLLLSSLMFFSLMMVLAMLSFWLINMWPLRSGINAVYLLLGGLYFPLNLLGPVYQYLKYNPFSLVTDFPARLLTGTTDQRYFFTNCLAVCCWLLLSVLLGKALFKKGIKTFEGAGA
ncbi:ABC transporter permease [Lactobacillus delbrueckii subsp. bulgaricus]|uniref:ABC-2 family transporter protein n=1 Tax=Lactobacillus delbrueckii TaxID=1584 RepID=UPI0021A49C28|nr:ABC-2 family transporter protein [Lactobacillus delbrueckii]MCT3465985.1 ABC transporter permease [Lactobacillus delbrueckii subsp. bulgaricus]MCT3470616.1 ABC transporter permease [Lactobacillus delbrueckii subsp. bulgaricus]